MASRYSTLAASLLLSSVSAIVIPREVLDFGSCTDPTINWIGHQGFYPASLDDFHQNPSADIGTISDFICSTLEGDCGAPEQTVSVCIGAKEAAKDVGLEGQMQADAFNNYILNGDNAIPSPTSTPLPPEPTNTANVTVLFSHQMVVFEEHLDPKWWFDNKIITNEEGITPKACGMDSEQMPNDYWITFGCAGADETVVPMMRAALNAMVDSTIDNDDIADDQRLFRHITETREICDNGDPVNNKRSINGTRALDPEHCETYTRKFTIMPREVHIVASGMTQGLAFLKGDLTYSIEKFESANCKMCAYFSAAGGGSAASVGARAAVVQTASKLLNPAVGLFSAIVTISCLASC